MSYEDLIRTAKGEIPFDIVIENTKVVNVYTQETYDANIGIHRNMISYVGDNGNVKSREVFDAKGMYAIPGLIDSHLHIESSMITPPRFAEAVLPHGTTTVAVDPHEICNVLGKQGVKMMLDSSKDLPLKVFVLAPTCVPAVMNADTAGAEIFADDVVEMLGWDRVIGLAEVMDYYGVINLDKRMADIVKAGRKANVVIDGHCMNLDSKQLNAYASTGIEANHEFFPANPGKGFRPDFEDIRQAMRIGLLAKLRKLSLVPEIVKLLKEVPNKQNILFVTDDVMPDDLLRHGHLDDVVREAIKNGFDPVEAVQSATLYPAKHLRLFDRGAIAPGKLADILLLQDLHRFEVDAVFADGKLTARKGKLATELPFHAFPKEAKETVRLQKLSEDAFRPRVDRLNGKGRVRVITMQGLLSDFEIKDAEIKDHIVQGDFATVSVFERHGRAGTRAVGLIDKFGLKEGAIASTIAHDSHNLIVVGMNPHDMAVAANALIECQGGLVAVRDGKVIAKLELPVAGLMSEEKPETVAAKLASFRKTEKELGVEDYGTILAVSTLALPVIAHARITDKGLFDVDRQKIVPLIVE